MDKKLDVLAEVLEDDMLDGIVAGADSGESKKNSGDDIDPNDKDKYFDQHNDPTYA